MAGEIDVLQYRVYQLAKEKGWWDSVERGDVSFIPKKLAFIHSEVSEALEVYREQGGPLRESVYADKDGERHVSQYADTMDRAFGANPRKPIGFDSEMADVVIRVMDLCAHLGIDLERAIREKHAFNETRPRRHGGKRC